MSVRGRVWAIYVDDLERPFATLMDADLALQPQRGWSTLGTAGLVPIPRGWLPRVAVGVDELGARHKAVVASTSADLWTGIRDDFDVEASDGTIQTCIVVSRLAERRVEPPF